MLTSIGAPSQVGEVLRTVSPLLDPVPHWRTLSAATVHVTPSAFGIAACATCAASSEPKTTDTSTSFRIASPVPRNNEDVSLGTPASSVTRPREYFSAC